MALTPTPAFAVIPRLTAVTDSTADTRGTTATIVSLITGAATGTKINEIVAKLNLNGASTAGAIIIWLSSDSGATWRVFDELLLAAATASASVASTRNSATYTNLVLPSAAWQIGVTNTVAQAVNVTCMAQDLT